MEDLLTSQYYVVTADMGPARGLLGIVGRLVRSKDHTSCCALRCAHKLFRGTDLSGGKMLGNLKNLQNWGVNSFIWIF